MTTLLTPESRAALVELLRRKEEERIRFFKPNPGAQEKFFELMKNKREIAYFAGNKSGKTFCGAKFVVQAALSTNAAKYGLEVLFERPVQIWVGSVDYKVQRESMQECIEYFLINAEVKKIHKLQNNIIDKIEFFNGSSIGFKTYDQGRRAWQGPKKDIILMDEEPPADVLSEARARLIGTDAKLIFTMTPLLGMTTVYYDFVENPKDYRGYVFGSTYENKEYLNPEYLQTLEDMPVREKQGRIYGQFVRLEGLVYDEFNKFYNVVPHFEPSPADFVFFGGMDFGAEHSTAFVVGGVDVDGHIYLFREYKNVDVFDEHVKAWKNMQKGYIIRRIFRDPSAKQAGLEFRKAGIRTFPGLNDRAVGISLMNGLFKQKKLYISDKLVNTIYELEHHKYKKDNSNGKDADVVKSDDDLLDGIRYMILTLIKARPQKTHKPIYFTKRVANFHPNW